VPIHLTASPPPLPPPPRSLRSRPPRRADPATRVRALPLPHLRHIVRLHALAHLPPGFGGLPTRRFTWGIVTEFMEVGGWPMWEQDRKEGRKAHWRGGGAKRPPSSRGTVSEPSRTEEQEEANLAVLTK
jgi:hypothetical protein